LQMLSRSVGNTISEYALILALLILVSIPVIGFLGQTVFSGLMQQASSTGSGANQLTSFIDPSYWEGSKKSFADPSEPIPQSTAALWKNVYASEKSTLRKDPRTGMFILETNGSGSDATSVSGGEDITHLFASNLEQLIEASGDLLTDENRSILEKLAKAGHELGYREEDFLKASPAEQNQKSERRYSNIVDDGRFKDKIVDIPESKVRTDLYSAYTRFGTAYKEAQALMDSLPEGDPLKKDVAKLVQQYSSVITNVALTNFIDRHQIGTHVTTGERSVWSYKIKSTDKKTGSSKGGKVAIKAEAADIPPADKNAPVEATGTISTEGITLEHAPEVTHENADRIRHARKEAKQQWLEKKADKDSTVENMAEL
jgi:hypothetical protein